MSITGHSTTEMCGTSNGQSRRARHMNRQMTGSSTVLILENEAVMDVEATLIDGWFEVAAVMTTYAHAKNG